MFFFKNAPAIRMKFVVIHLRHNGSKKSWAFLFPSSLTVTNQVMGIVGWITARHAHGCFNPARVFLLTQRRRLGSFMNRFRRLDQR